MSNLAIHWTSLKKEKPCQVCQRSLARYDGRAYHLEFLNEVFRIDLEEENIRSSRREAPFELSVVFLVYLLHAQERPFTNRWVSANELPHSGGFFRGIHSFPLQRIIEKYSGNPEEFIKRAKECGGETLRLYPYAVSFQPLPRIRLGFVYWPGGGEFPDQVNAIFDQSCGFQLPPDALWALVRQVITVMTRG